MRHRHGGHSPAAAGDFDCRPGFFAPQPKPDDLQLLDVIPANLIDAAFNSGVRNATAAAARAGAVTPPQPARTASANAGRHAPARAAKVETPEPIKETGEGADTEPKPAEKPKIQTSTQTRSTRTRRKIRQNQSARRFTRKGASVGAARPAMRPEH